MRSARIPNRIAEGGIVISVFYRVEFFYPKSWCLKNHLRNIYMHNKLLDFKKFVKKLRKTVSTVKKKISQFPSMQACIWFHQIAFNFFKIGAAVLRNCRRNIKFWILCKNIILTTSVTHIHNFNDFGVKQFRMT